MSVADALNPYAPPPGPVQIDFREAAVEESLRILEASQGRRADELGLSLVLPADVAGLATLRYVDRMTLLRMLLGIGGIMAGAVLAAFEKSLVATGVPGWLLLPLAGCCTLSGIGLLMANGFLVRAAVRRGLGERYEFTQRLNTVGLPLCVAVEDARTFAKMKLAPEDFAYAAFDAPGRRLILEGLLFRYLIHAADVLTVGQAQGATTTGAQIVFRVGAVVVGVTLQHDSLWRELKRQTIGAGSDPLLMPLRKVLGKEN